MSLSLEARIQTRTNREIADLAYFAKVRRKRAITEFAFRYDSSRLNLDYVNHPFQRAKRWINLEHILYGVLFSRTAKGVEK